MFDYVWCAVHPHQSNFGPLSQLSLALLLYSTKSLISDNESTSQKYSSRQTRVRLRKAMTANKKSDWARNWKWVNMAYFCKSGLSVTSTRSASELKQDKTEQNRSFHLNLQPLEAHGSSSRVWLSRRFLFFLALLIRFFPLNCHIVLGQEGRSHQSEDSVQLLRFFS